MGMAQFADEDCPLERVHGVIGCRAAIARKWIIPEF